MSNIEWTEETWNPVAGCSLASPGCTNCYAMKMAGRLEAMGVPAYQGTTKKSKAGFVWTGLVNTAVTALTKPIRWKKPRQIFVNSMSDLFHPDVTEEWIDRVFAVMALCPQHTFQLLTKRSARMRDYLNQAGRYEAIYNAMGWLGRNSYTEPYPYRKALPNGMEWPLPNVWMGVSTEDQQRADERIPDLLATPAAVRFISAEPLLGPVDLTAIPAPDEVDGKTFEEGWSFNSLDTGDYYSQRSENTFGDVFYSGGNGPDREHALDWVIAGGESGPGARGSTDEVEANMRSLRDQCAAANVAFFGKQNFAKKKLPADLINARAYPATKRAEN
jgi:protein gp37